MTEVELESTVSLDCILIQLAYGVFTPHAHRQKTPTKLLVWSLYSKLFIAEAWLD